MILSGTENGYDEVSYLVMISNFEKTRNKREFT